MRVLGLAVCIIALTSTAEAFGPSDVVSTLLKPLRGPFGVKEAKGDSRRARTLEEHHNEEMSAEEEAEEESHIKFGYVVGLLALAGTFIGGFILEEMHITWLPEAGVGILLGCLVAYLAIATGNDSISAHEKFDFEFFMTWLLPPIIFDAGYNMQVVPFIQNLGPTMFFAFVGTFASTFVVGGIVYAGGQLGVCYPMGMLACLTFGSLISATDPVTVLAVFSALGVKVDLFSMVFGESVLNDAVAIVLSRTLLGFNVPGAEVNAASILAAGVSFCKIFGGSLLIGAVAGFASALVFKTFDMRHHPELLYMQCAVSVAFPYAGYYASEGLELSGIVTILACGMIMDIYTKKNFSEEARELTSKGYHWVAVVAETYVFVYLGMAVFTFPIFQNTTYALVGVALGACFIGRLHIYVGSYFTNMFRSDTTALPPISSEYMFAMWWSGLRGGVAFAIASVSYGNNDFPVACGGLAPEDRTRPECLTGVTDSLAILQTTLMIAVFTIFVFGGAITNLAICLGVLAPKGSHCATNDASDTAPKEGFEAYHHETLMPTFTLPPLPKGHGHGHGDAESAEAAPSGTMGTLMSLLACGGGKRTKSGESELI